MTNWYVRPSGGTYGAEDGTSYADAWDGFTNVGTVSPGDRLYYCGTFTNEILNFQQSGTLANPIIIDGSYSADPGIIERYKESVTGDWTEVNPSNPTLTQAGSNFWIADTQLTGSNDTKAVWFGAGWTENEVLEYWSKGTTTFTDVIPGNVPSADYETATFKGGGGTNSHVGVYSVGNPVTYYGSVRWASDTQHRPIQVANASHVHLVGGTIRRCGIGIQWVNTVDSTTLENLKLDGMTFNQIAYGFSNVSSAGTARFVDGIEITGCSFSNVASSGVWLNPRALDVDIHQNQFTDVGYSYSTGGVYAYDPEATAAKPIVIRQNTFLRCLAGHYWTYDGGAIQIDVGTKNMSAYRNEIVDCNKGFHDNSGQENWFFSNLLIGCASVSLHTDSNLQNNSQPHIVHNIATGLTCDGSYSGGNVSLNSAVRIDNIVAGANDIQVKNNIFTTADNTKDALMRHDNVAADWDEDYNCVHGFDNVVVDTASNPESVGANTVTIDPSLDARYRPRNATLVGAGVAVAGVTTDYDGHPYSNPPSIGHLEMRTYMTSGIPLPNTKAVATSGRAREFMRAARKR